MRHRKWLAVLLLVIAAALSLPVFGEEESGEEAGVYAYILNDYMLEYGIISTPTRGGTIQGEDSIFPQGVIYADLVDFDRNGQPYLVIYCVDGWADVAECHIWKYYGGSNAEKVGIISKPYNYGRYETGAFFQGTAGSGVSVISWTRENEGQADASECYTVRDSNILSYLKEPDGLVQTEIMRYNRYSLRPGVDVSAWNVQLSRFFDSLKQQAADSISYTNYAAELSEEEKGALSAALLTGGGQEGYPEEVRQIKGFYSLGADEYYVLYSTPSVSWSEAVVKRGGEGEYTVIDAKFDCIPKSGEQISTIAPAQASGQNTISDEDKRAMFAQKAKGILTPWKIVVIVLSAIGVGIAAVLWVYILKERFRGR